MNLRSRETLSARKNQEASAELCARPGWPLGFCRPGRPAGPTLYPSHLPNRRFLRLSVLRGRLPLPRHRCRRPTGPAAPLPVRVLNFQRV